MNESLTNDTKELVNFHLITKPVKYSILCTASNTKTIQSTILNIHISDQKGIKITSTKVSNLHIVKRKKPSGTWRLPQVYWFLIARFVSLHLHWKFCCLFVNSFNGMFTSSEESISAILKLSKSKIWLKVRYYLNQRLNTFICI